MLLSVVTRYLEHHGWDRRIEWPTVASEVADAGVTGRDLKSCRLRQELLIPTPNPNSCASLFHARLTVPPMQQEVSCVSRECTAGNCDVKMPHQHRLRKYEAQRRQSTLIRAGYSPTYVSIVRFCSVGGLTS